MFFTERDHGRDGRGMSDEGNGRMQRCLLAVGVVLGLVVLPAQQAGADDYSDTALNIIPSGQWGTVPIPAGADDPG